MMFRLLTLLVLVILALSGCKTKPQGSSHSTLKESPEEAKRRHEQNTIREVIQDTQWALLTYRETPQERMDREQLAKDLRKAEFMRCPEDFRLAWIQFIHAVESASAPEARTGIKEILALASFATAPSLSGLAGVGTVLVDGSAPKSSWAEKWQAVEVSAVRHGVSVPAFNTKR